MAQTILPTASNQPEEWKPSWTVITSPPNFAERWAMRSASHWQAGMAVPILWLIFAILDSWTMWRTGNNQEVIILVAILGVISAIVAWDRYAFGQLVARYEAELRDIQTRHPTA